MIERIAILGTGLLGTSVGLALRAAGYRGAITGWNRSREHAELALRMGAIDAFAGVAGQPGGSAGCADLCHTRFHGEACAGSWL